MNSIVVIPKYLLKYLPVHYHATARSIPPEIEYKYTQPTMTEIARAHGLTNFDVALPVDWVRDFQFQTGFNPVGHFVYDYSSNSFGMPFPVTIEGQVAYQIYKHIEEK